MVGRVQQAVGVKVTHHVAVLGFQGVHVGDQLLHGPGFFEIGPLQRLNLLSRQVGAYRPGRSIFFEGRFGAEERRNDEPPSHVHGADNGPGLGVRLARPHLAVALVEHAPHGHVVLDACLAVQVEGLVERDTRRLIPPVGIEDQFNR